jgi:DNA-binding winged helix-turn-helix (wHTH) protein
MFGPFVLDLGHRELRRDGQKVKLTAKPFDTLAFLVENHGQVVTRDQLRAVVWEGLAVSDPAVEHAVNKIRRVLGDDPVNPFFIQTLWGKGYIFVAEVAGGGSAPASGAEIPARVATTAGPEERITERESLLTAVPSGGLRLRWRLPAHALQIGFACMMYAGLYVLSVFVETAYALDRYRSSLGAVGSVIFLWIVSTTLAAVWSDWRLTKKSDLHGLTVAVVIMTAAAGALFLGLGGFLPGSAITLFAFQGFTAHAAYLKSEIYFVMLAVAFMVLPFHFIVRVEHELRAGRPDIAWCLLSRRTNHSKIPAMIYPRPVFLLALLVISGFWSLFSIAHLFEYLLPSPHMNRYMNLLQIQRLTYFALGLECLGWYHLCLGRLQRDVLAAVRSVRNSPAPS